MPSGTVSRDVVLVVDDSRAELGMLVDALEQSAFTVLAATGGEAALALLDKLVPHLIMMDAVMPGIDGFETCRRLKADSRFAHLPVIFMTGLSDTEHVIKGLEVGGVDYVTKPVVIAELIARIRVHVANARVAFGARVALDATGRYLLACDRSGNVRWCTPQTGSLLESIFPGVDLSDVKLPTAITEQLRQVIATGSFERPCLVEGSKTISVSFLSEIGPDELLFRLAETAEGSDEALLRQKLMLTTREAEILIWVAHGKSNRDISEILRISPRTVNKHLERIFSKIGVENRSSATSVAMRILASNGDGLQ